MNTTSQGPTWGRMQEVEGEKGEKIPTTLTCPRGEDIRQEPSWGIGREEQRGETTRTRREDRDLIGGEMERENCGR